jgi:hypothetical protein
MVLLQLIAFGGRVLVCRLTGEILLKCCCDGAAKEADSSTSISESCCCDTRERPAAHMSACVSAPAPLALPADTAAILPSFPAPRLRSLPVEGQDTVL